MTAVEDLNVVMAIFIQKKSFHFLWKDFQSIMNVDQPKRNICLICNKYLQQFVSCS